jgi:hypothetical protein
MIFTSFRALIRAGVAVAAALVFGHAAWADGSKAFVMRPKFGAAQVNLPSTVSWQATANPNGSYRVALRAETDVRPVLANIRLLSAKALDRSPPCADAVKVLYAAAKLMGATTLRYDLRFHFVKRVCAGGYPVEMPADVTCAARIALSARRSIVVIDVQGATAPPCRIDGAYQVVSDAVYTVVGIDVFRRHAIDLARNLPPEFKGVTIDIKSLSFDLPPAAATLRIAGESTMSKAQFDQFMARIDAAAPRTN